MTETASDLKAKYDAVKQKIQEKENQLKDLEEKIKMMQLRFDIMSQITPDHLKKADLLVNSGLYKTRGEALASMFEFSDK